MNKMNILYLDQEESLIHDSQIISNHSTTARDVVLQKCSQNCYISFADRFPNSYVDICIYLYRYINTN